MPIPFIIIGAAVAVAAAGAGAGAKGGVDIKKAKDLHKNTEERLDRATLRLEDQRKECSMALQNLGEEKIFVLNNSLRIFVEEFSKLKNVDFRDSVGLDELSKLTIDKVKFQELVKLGGMTKSLLGGAVAGTAGGALVAVGAYGAAATFATASTGTAIASLSGVAASNATLAFFGGGSLAAGGLGMAGGAAVLGGIVAAPAILAMGIVLGVHGKKQLDKEKINALEANETCAQLELGADQCIAIRRRTGMFYNLLASLDSLMQPLAFKMQDIVKDEGIDYFCFKKKTKKIVAEAAACAVSIKAVLDMPILTADGSLTEESEKVVWEI